VQQTLIVVPCYNEAQRLDVDAFVQALRQRPWLRLVLVNDGSSDQTSDVLAKIEAEVPDRVSILSLPENVGKGEAVRRGMVGAFATGTDVVGYWDADLATPFRELDAMLGLMEAAESWMVLGSRVQLLGRNIRRKYVRHLVGRVFATAASMALRLPVYDTQCGAKIIRNVAEIRDAFDHPFRSRWAFDVELIERILERAGPLREARGEQWAAIVEYPLESWVDVAGSKLRLSAALRATADLVSVAIRTRRAVERDVSTLPRR